MITFNIKYFNLALIMSTLIFKAYASDTRLKDINDVPDEIISVILSNCDLHIAENRSMLYQVSKKFNKLANDFDIEITNSKSAGIATLFKFEKSIKTFFNGIGMSFCPSKNQEFNEKFNFIAKENVAMIFNSIPSIYHRDDSQIQVNEIPTLKYPRSNQLSFKDSENSSVIFEPIFCLTPKSSTLMNEPGKVYIFPTKKFIKFDKEKNQDFFWPFERVTEISYTDYSSTPLEENDDELKILVDSFELRNPDITFSHPLYPLLALPENFSCADYTVSGKLKKNIYKDKNNENTEENNSLTFTYRFVVDKGHTKVMKGLIEGSLPKR